MSFHSIFLTGLDKLSLELYLRKIISVYSSSKVETFLNSLNIILLSFEEIMFASFQIPDLLSNEQWLIKNKIIIT